MYLRNKTLLLFVLLVLASVALTGMTLASPDVNGRTNERIEMQFSARYECLGEDIWVTGVVHVVSDVTQRGDSVTIFQHVNSHFTGVGQTTGNQYIVNETSTHRQVQRVSDLVLTGYSEIWNYRAISQGSAPNFTFHINMHWRWVNGELVFEQYHYVC